MTENTTEKSNKTTADALSKIKVEVVNNSMPVEKSKHREINGPKGLEPTRYGDWESKGRCYDF